MRLKNAILFSKFLLLIAGTVFTIAAVFAVQLGLDHNANWGRGRYLLALCGGLCLLAVLVLQFPRPLLDWRQRSTRSRLFRDVAWPFQQAFAGIRRVQLRIAALPLACWLADHPRLTSAFSAGLGVSVVLLVSLCYITSGTWHWTPYTDYFDKLAQAFLSGQVALLEKPPAALLALKNPYDYHNRQGIGYLWDASLFQGRYYYYWGPVPGLVAAGVKGLAGLFGSVPRVEDQILLFFFLSGLAIVNALLLYWLRERFFPHAPPWTLLMLVLLGGLAMPVFWLINRPSVYETAIAGGQFFLFLGLYFAIRALTSRSIQPGWLLAAGLTWGAAVNCRLNLALAVIFFALVLVWQWFQRTPKPVIVWSRLLWLGVPLLLWAAGLGWYNAARFGSMLETGHRYQLTGMALPNDYRAITSFSYLIPSLYSYVLRPFRFSPGEFPFISVPYIKESMWPFFIHLPAFYYYSEPVAGLLTSVPGTWLGLLPLLGWVRRGWLWLHEQSDSCCSLGAPTWLWGMVIGGVLCLFLPLLVFISSSMRYLADVTPLLVLLSALGFWWGLAFFQEHPMLRTALVMAAWGLVLLSILLSLLANLTNGDKRFEANNPALYYAIANFFK